MPTLELVARLPDVDEWGVPLDKVPNCPNCGEDELGMVQADRAVCNLCGCLVVKSKPGQHILDVPAICRQCPWMGTVHGCEISDNGDLHCPQCGDEIVIRIDKDDIGQC